MSSRAERIGIRGLVAATAVTAVSLGAGVALAAEGDLDPSFGTGGSRQSDVNGGSIQAIALQPDGKIVAVGSGNGDGTDDDRAVMGRYTPGGNPDIGFGLFGFVDTQFEPPFAAGTQADFDGVVVRPGGQIVTAGTIDPPAASPAAIAVAQWTAAGAPDNSFSTDGVDVLTPSSGSDSFGHDVALAADGDVVVAGETSTPGDNIQFAVARFSATGLDTSFNNAGTPGFRVINASTASNGDDRAFGAAIDPNDQDIVLVGTADIGSDGGATESDIAVVRLTSAGALDSAFGGGDGIARIDIDATNTPAGAEEDDQGADVAITPAGKIVITGNRIDGANIDHYVLRLNADGTPDTSFGDGGDGVTLGTGSANFGRALTLLPDGRVVVVGLKVAGNDMLVRRFTAAGLPDTSFAGDSELTLDFGLSADADAVAVQPDGKLLVAGGIGGEWGLARLQGPDPPPSSSGGGGGGVQQALPPKKCKKGQKLKKGKCVKKKKRKKGKRG